MTIGAYAFATRNWKELEYPLDLWVQHNSLFFDEISLAVELGTEIDFPVPSNVRLSYIGSRNEEDRRYLIFYISNKDFAMKCLRTDWKLLLDIDEFIDARTDTTGLNKKYVYGTNNHHLFGNIHTEILNIFPDHYWRLHYGDRYLLNDGGSVYGRRARQFRSIQEISGRPILRTLRHEGIRRLLTKPLNAVEIYHTNTVRSPAAMHRKWIEQTQRDPFPDLSKFHLRAEVYKVQNPYQLMYGEWKGAALRTVKTPSILVDNPQRFANFEVA